MKEAIGENGFAVLYRWTIAPGHEEEFLARWRAVTEDLRDNHGGLGSCLARDADGAFVAFARWPSRAVRDRANAVRVAVEPPAYILSFTQTELTVEADMLVGPGESGAGAVQPP